MIMGDTLDNDAYVGWFSYLFPRSGSTPLVLVSAGVTAGIFALGYVIAWIGAVDYVSVPLWYIGAFGIFWTLLWLGWADQVYVGVWNDARPAFGVDDETYNDVVRPQLEQIYNTRRILGYWTVLVIPSFVIAAGLWIPDVPFHGTIEDLFLQSGYSAHTHGNQLLRLVVVYLFVVVGVLLFATIINGFENHLSLIREASALQFRDIHTAASELAPVARFTMASATAWFVGISVVVLLISTGLDRAIGLPVIAILVLAGVLFFVAPQMILHAALLDAKRELLAELRKEYEAIQKRAQRDTDSPDALSLRLDVTDRQLESAKSIRTWAYDISSVGKLVAASIIPWFNIIIEFRNALA